jgi:Mg/Co/Ni transporter MgtE
MQAMPMLVLGLAALAWIIVRGLVLRRADGQAGAVARRDLWVSLAVAASWLAVWGLYSAYFWTNDPSEDTLQTARFYVPAIGAISLLGAWLVTRIPGRAWLAGLTSAAVVAAMFGLGAWSFHAMVAVRLGP